MTDTELETAIGHAYEVLMKAEDLAIKRAAFHLMVVLIRERSPEQVQRMEIARGLR